MNQQNDLNQIEERAKSLPVQVKDLGEKITSEASLKRTRDAKLYVRKIRNEIKAVFEPMKKKAYAAYKEILTKWKTIEKPVIEAEKYCDNLLSDYFTEQRRIREQAEKERQEQIQKQKEKEQEKIQEAIEAENAGYDEMAENIINETINNNDETKELVVPEKEKIEGMHTRKHYGFEITDANKIPKEFLIPDEKLIRRHIVERKGDTSIPGVKIIIKDIVVTKK